MKIDGLVSRTEGFSGAQIASVCSLAALSAVRRVVAGSKTPRGGQTVEADSTQRKPASEFGLKILIDQSDLEAGLAEVTRLP